MRPIHHLISAFALLLTVSTGVRADSIPIVGKMDIDYQTRVQTDADGHPQPGVKDLYKIDLNIANASGFQGTITHQPTIFSKILGRETQSGELRYDLLLVVRNPADPSQTRTIGKMVGTVPIDAAGVYQYDLSNLRVAVDTTGQVTGFESKFRGKAAGKPPRNDSALADTKNKAAIQMSKWNNGKLAALQVTNYDLMNLSGLVLAAGPTQGYPDTTVNGKFLYDYDRDVWGFTDATMTYAIDGKSMPDRLGGTIRWVEDPNRASNGKGEYQFDVRLNAPEKGTDEAAAFKPVDDEAAFFAPPDPTLSALTGTAKYQDTMSGDTVTKSVVTINLTGTNLTKPQAVALSKLVWLVSVVPMNAE